MNALTKKLLALFLPGLACMNLLSCRSAPAAPDYSDEAAQPADMHTIDTIDTMDEAREARNQYNAFLEQEDMYALTATAAYPRGDSRAKYAIGDCTGDNVPELHLTFGTNYYIYTYRDKEVVLLRDFSQYPLVIPAENGAIIVSEQSETGDDTIQSSYRIPQPDDPFAETLRIEGSRDYYGYLVLDEYGYPMDSKSQSFTSTYQGNQSDGKYLYHMNEKECTKAEWEKEVGICLEIMEDESKQMAWEYIFPKEEWDYLDAMEEGNGVQEDMDSGEWAFYQRLLSGEYQWFDAASQSRFHSRYMASLDETTGRSNLKYILMDFNGDGSQDLFIQYDSSPANYTTADFSYENVSRCIGFFSYADGKPYGWISDGATGVRFIPLRNGQMIHMEGYAVTEDLYLGVSHSRYSGLSEIEKAYHLVYVDLSHEDYFYDRNWYENSYGKDRVFHQGETLHFVQEYMDDHPAGGQKELSEEEWAAVEEMIGELLIPDSEWKPASVFPPNRYPAGFSQG